MNFTHISYQNSLPILIQDTVVTMMNSPQEEPTPLRIPERNLRACAALTNTVVGALWKECGFSCEYPEGSNIPEARLVSGDPISVVQEALHSFHERYEIPDDVWEWMIGMVITSLRSNADYWEFLSKGSIEAWASAQWMRAKLSKVKLAWLMGENDDGHRQEAATHAIARHVFEIAAQALDEDDQGEPIS